MQTPVSRLGLLVNFTRPHAREGLEVLLQAAREAGIQLLAASETAAISSDLQPCRPEDFARAGAQGVISLGGDGSFLAASHTLAKVDLPLIGLNIGHLGYLTAVNEEGFARVLKDLAKGAYTLDARTTLRATLRQPDALDRPLSDALNDVVLSRAEGGRAIAVCLELDHCPVARWICDGVILSTPTGSTAYSLSVGGPVVVPSAKVIVINVIAPHTLSARPLVVPETTQVTLRLDKEDTAAAVYVDGVVQTQVRRDEAVEVTLSPRPVRMILPETNNPYLPLSRKLRWGEAFTR